MPTSIKFQSPTLYSKPQASKNCSSAGSNWSGGTVQPLQRRLPPLWLLHNSIHGSCPRKLTLLMLKKFATTLLWKTKRHSLYSYIFFCKLCGWLYHRVTDMLKIIQPKNNRSDPKITKLHNIILSPVHNDSEICTLPNAEAVLCQHPRLYEMLVNVN